MDEEVYIKIGEAAKILRISPSTVRSLERSKDLIPTISESGHRKYKLKDVKALNDKWNDSNIGLIHYTNIVIKLNDKIYSAIQSINVSNTEIKICRYLTYGQFNNSDFKRWADLKEAIDVCLVIKQPSGKADEKNYDTEATNCIYEVNVSNDTPFLKEWLTLQIL